jgi:hypothetical protein
VRGDFSRWQFRPRDNFNGILPQQGKLLIDADGLAQTRIVNHWQQTAGRDWVGAVAGYTADEAASFLVTAATINGDGTVTVTAGSGHIWADGMLVQLGDDAPTVTRTATWLEPPTVPTPGTAATAVAGAQDVVVLEFWQEGINGYQMPTALIEPALGGPDTAERLHTGAAFRLARLTPGQNCSSIAFNDSGRGKLTVSLQPVTVIAGDCPIPVGGGYSGFEHRLYRIEIADVPAGSPSMFKWSRENGGLVGRGNFKPGAANTLTINANLVAITTANQPSFDVEIEQWDKARGNWQVVCRGNATLNGGTLTFNGAAAYGTYPAAQGDVFFRLWDGTAAVSTFPVQPNPKQLEDGIFLQFDADAAGAYRPRDYWVFPVRAAGIANPQVLINQKPPEGIVYHRVPLAEITWGAGGVAETIDDCRELITPLTQRRGCCTVEVGDGVSTFARFTSIQAAINSLPAEGGEVCVLAGRYFEAINLGPHTGVTIHGCGHRTRIASPSLGPARGANTGAVISITNSQDIELRNLVIEAADGDLGIELNGTASAPAAAARAAAVKARSGVTDVLLRDLIVVSSTQPAVSVEQARDIRLQDSLIAMRDVTSSSAAVYVSGQQIHVTGNWIGPVTAAILPAVVTADLGTATGAVAFSISVPTAKAPCGIQIAGISRDIYVRDNEISGGSGNGITLGGLILTDATGKNVNGYVGYNPSGGARDPCAPGSFFYTPTVKYRGATVNVVVDGRLTNVHIENNIIRNMGLCGIGPIGFFNLKDTQEVVTVDTLSIVSNEITSCLHAPLAKYTLADSSNLGYGGICLPDVTATIIRDNVILNTGATLADPVCGIFALHAAELEISRNRIEDNRDWSRADASTLSGFRAGIALALVTPADSANAAAAWTSTSSVSYKSSLYEHDAPALCIQENVVNVPVGLALSVAGLGAFSIRGNHFSTRGIPGEKLSLARAILILNFGTPLESPAPVSNVANILALLEALNAGASLAQAYQTVVGGSQTIIGAIAPGPVNFSQNRCSLNQNYEATTAWAATAIFTFDDLGFHDNQCWVAAPQREVDCNAILIGATVRVTGCRFQEMLRAVNVSALTFGLMNITTMNEATHPLAALGPPQSSVITPNVVV